MNFKSKLSRVGTEVSIKEAAFNAQLLNERKDFDHLMDEKVKKEMLFLSTIESHYSEFKAKLTRSGNQQALDNMTGLRGDWIKATEEGRKKFVTDMKDLHQKCYSGLAEKTLTEDQFLADSDGIVYGLRNEGKAQAKNFGKSPSQIGQKLKFKNIDEAEASLSEMNKLEALSDMLDAYEGKQARRTDSQGDYGVAKVAEFFKALNIEQQKEAIVKLADSIDKTKLHNEMRDTESAFCKADFGYELAATHNVEKALEMMGSVNANNISNIGGINKILVPPPPPAPSKEKQGAGGAEGQTQKQNQKQPKTKPAPAGPVVKLMEEELEGSINKTFQKERDDVIALINAISKDAKLIKQANSASIRFTAHVMGISDHVSEEERENLQRFRKDIDDAMEIKAAALNKHIIPKTVSEKYVDDVKKGYEKMIKREEAKIEEVATKMHEADVAMFSELFKVSEDELKRLEKEFVRSRREMALMLRGRNSGEKVVITPSIKAMEEEEEQSKK